jgi:flavodoxin
MSERAGTFIDAAVSIVYVTSHGNAEASLTEAAERIAEEIERRENEQEEERLDEDASS